MKKIIIIIIMGILFMIPQNTYASNDVKITCDKTKIAPNETAICKISVQNLNFAVTNITAKVNVSENVTIIESSYNKDIWMSLDSSFNVQDINLIRNANTQVNSLEIATFKVEARNNATDIISINFNNIKMGNSEYNSVSLESTQINLSLKSSDNSLKILKVNDTTLDVNSIENNINVDLDNVNIQAIPNDSNAKIEGIGNQKINYGENIFYVTVIAENGNSKKYILKINREDDRDTNNYLKELKVSAGNINFDKNKTEYNLEVEDSVETIVITAELDANDSTFVNGYGPRIVNLNYGKNEIYIKVKSESQIEKSYIINIFRKDERSSNNYLKDIKLSFGNIKFEKEKTNYTITVPNNITNLKIEPILEDKKSTYEINGRNELLIGENEFVIKVIAENTEFREYKLIIRRSEKTSIANPIKNIIIKNHELIFDQNIYEYNLETTDKKLNIEVVLENKNAKYKIEGNENLKNGSIIYITIQEEENIEYIYRINIVNNKEKSNLFNVIIMILLAISMIINLILTIFILKKKSN